MTPLLAGKTALVTGGSKGVGRGIALELARHGCDVAVNYHSDRAGADETVAAIQQLGRQAFAVGGHVGQSAAVDALFAAVDAQFAQLDILVCNAGVQTWKPLLELAEDEWDRVLDTNLKGTFLCTQRAARRMKNTGGGRIVIIGSACNKWAFPRLVDYTASKGGIEQFTKVAAVELGPLNITVNCVAPGAIEIERTRETEGEEYGRIWAERTPLGRVGRPDDIGKAVAFFCGPQADWVSGQTLYVDGACFTKPDWPYQWK